MKFTKTQIEDVVIIENDTFGDERGWFSEIFKIKELEEFTNSKISFVQANESYSQHNILRGIHFQNPNPQGKLVKVVSGEVFDVAVDLRKSSPTFGHWVGVTLSGANKKQLWIPEGFGHGFYVTGEHAHFTYMCTNYYDPKNEHCLRFDDPIVNIKWPEIKNLKPQVSPKDKNGLGFKALVYF